MRNAKVIVSIFLVLVLALSLPTSAKDWRWEPQGYLRFVIGYFQGEGMIERYLAINDLFGYSYSADLSGIIFKDRLEMTYSLTKEPYSDLDWRFRWENPLFTAQHNIGLKSKMSKEFPYFALALNFILEP